MQRSETSLGAVLVLLAATLPVVAGCEALVGIDEVVVTEETAVATRADASSEPAPASDTAASPSTTRGRVCGEVSAAVACLDALAYADGPKLPQYKACADSCSCALGLYCTTAHGGYAGRCCKMGACGAPCTVGCDCASNVCLLGECR